MGPSTSTYDFASILSILLYSRYSTNSKDVCERSTSYKARLKRGQPQDRRLQVNPLRERSRHHWFLQQLQQQLLLRQNCLRRKQGAKVDGGSALERYKALSDEEFEGVFGSKREVFEAFPAWKQTQAKKKSGYF